MLAAKLFLAVVLGAAAGHKWTARDRLAAAAARLAGARPSQGPLLLLAAGAVEGLAALALLTPGLAAVGALIAAALWSLYAAALWRHRGERIDCGCDFVRREKPVAMGAIARPLFLAAVAFALPFLPEGEWSPDAPFAALAFVALWFAAGELFSLPLVSRTR